MLQQDLNIEHSFKDSLEADKRAVTYWQITREIHKEGAPVPTAIDLDL